MTVDMIAIVDTETQGLDASVHSTIEVACVLWSVRAGSTIEAWSTLLEADENPAEPINRISTTALSMGMARTEAFARLLLMVERADIWMAHRAAFDASFLPDMPRPVVCSKFDIEWPRSKAGASLVEVALAHDVPVHANHRALTDCMLLAKVLERVVELGHDLPTILARAMRPKALFRVSDTNFDEARNALAKAHSFRWEKPYWVRSMAIEDAASLPFAVTQVSP